MPTGQRIRGNNSYGIVSDNPLTIGATSFNSAGLATLPPVAGSHALVTLDPLRQFGEPEIVLVTAHTPAATVATISRGAYGTVARQHPQGTVWVHAPIDEDFTKITASALRPTDPYRGQTIFENDTNRYVGRTITDTWQQYGLFFDPPACRVTHNTTQSIANGAAGVVLAFNTERYDTDSMHDVAVSNNRITFNTAGIYEVGASIAFSGNDYTRIQAWIRMNGTTIIGIQNSDGQLVGGAEAWLSLSTVYKFVASDYVELVVTQTNGAAASRSVLNQLNYSPEFSATWIGRGNVI